jgi:hypothetical protein
METSHYLCILLILLLVFFAINIMIEKNKKKKYKNENSGYLSISNDERMNQEYILPKVIYCFWDNDSKLINAFVNTWRRNVPKDWKIEFINNDNLMNYVDENFYVVFQDLKKKEAFRFADFLRFYLLIKNGGVWMDASMIVVNGRFLDDYYNEMHKKKAEILFYELNKYSVKGAPYLENWFLMAPKNSKFALDIYNEFLYAYHFGFYRYKRKILEPSVFLQTTLNGNGIYLMQHAIIIYLLHKNKNSYYYLVKDTNESMYKICDMYNWDRHKLIDHIIYNDISDLYAIKINGYQRQAIKDVDIMIQKLDSV